MEVCFTDQNNRPLEIEDNENITLISGTSKYKQDIQLNQEEQNMLKDMNFYHLQEKIEINMVKS